MVIHKRPSGDSNISDGSDDSSIGSRFSSDDSIVSAANAKRRYPGPTVPPYKWDFGGIGTCVLVSLVIGTAACILEVVAFTTDIRWNSVVEGLDDFGTVDNKMRTYFKNKRFNLPEDVNELVNVKELISRDEAYEPFAIIFMGTFLMFFYLLLLAVKIYPDNDGINQSFAVLHEVGGLVMFISAILILISDSNVDSSHLDAARELGNYLQRLTGPTKPPNIPIENELFIIKEVSELKAIQEACALSKSSRHGRYSVFHSNIYISIDNQDYTLDDLHSLGFCSYEIWKFSAFICCLVYALLCVTVPVSIFYNKKRKQRKLYAKVHPLSSVQGDKNKNIGSVIPPAYGYGLPPTHKSLEYEVRPFDPRYAPVAPRPDLAIVTSNRKSSSQSKDDDQHKIFSDSHKYKRFHEGSFDDDAPSISFDSFEPQMFASYEDLPRVKKTESPAVAPRKSPPKPKPPPAPEPEEPELIDSDHDIDVIADSHVTPVTTPHHELPDLPEVPKKKREAKKGEYVYKSPYTVRRYPE